MAASPPLGSHSAVTVNQRHTHASASTSPQHKQQQPNPARPPVDPRPHASPRQDQNLTAPASLVPQRASLPGVKSTPSTTKPSKSLPIASSKGSPSNHSGAKSLATSSSSSSPRTQRREQSISMDRSRAASGTLDRIANQQSASASSANASEVNSLMRQRQAAAIAASEKVVLPDGSKRAAEPEVRSQPQSSGVPGTDRLSTPSRSTSGHSLASDATLGSSRGANQASSPHSTMAVTGGPLQGSPASTAKPAKSRAAQAVDDLDSLAASSRGMQLGLTQPSAHTPSKASPVETKEVVQPTNGQTSPRHGVLQPAQPRVGTTSPIDSSNIEARSSVEATPSHHLSSSKMATLGNDASNGATSSSTQVVQVQVAANSGTKPIPRESPTSSSHPVDYESLIRDGGKAKPMEVVSCLEVSDEELEQLVTGLVEKAGEPLVITDLHKTAAWSSDLFTPQSIPASDEKELLDGEGVRCPIKMEEALAKLVHPCLQYQYEHDVPTPGGRSKSPKAPRCRFDSGPSRTPLKHGACSSLVQNLMIWSDPDASATWLITTSDDADAVDAYIASKGGDAASGEYIPQAKELAEAPFPISAWTQRVGDLVLIPSRASYMVINAGGRTLETSWPRLTAESLQSALYTDLPLYQRRCQKQPHRVKSIIENALIAYTQDVQSNLVEKVETPKGRIRDLRTLVQLYDSILSDEYVPDWRSIMIEGEYNSYVECDFCGADVLHGFFECRNDETLCAQCYSQGRLCGCADTLVALQPRQLWRSFGDRLEYRNLAARALLAADPTLALTIEQRAHAGGDDEDDEPAMMQVELLREEEIIKRSWPLSFLAATNLHKLRQTAKWREDVAPCKICKAVLDISQRYFCKPCGHSYCYGCLLHKLYIHPAHALAQNEPKLFHGYHKKASTLDYKEWKQDPFEFRDEARAHFALIEAARTNMKCSPQNQSCAIGFLDVSDSHPYGLSGTLGGQRPIKAQVEKTKHAGAASSPSSTPVSRKRTTDSIQASSAASPRSPSRKKAKIDAPVHLVPTEEEQAAVQTATPGKAAARASASSQSPRTDMQGTAGIDRGQQIGHDQPVTSLPTVAGGIRRFVLREGKAHPISPVSVSPSVSALPSSSPSTSPLVTPKIVPSQAVGSQFLGAAPSTAGKISKATPANGLTKSQPASNASSGAANAPTSFDGMAARTSLTPPTKTVASTESGSAPAKPAAPSAATNSTAEPSSALTNIPIPSTSVKPPTLDQGTLALATSVVAAGITSSSPAPAAGSPERSSEGLGSLDPMTLRVVTEILRIYTQANDKKLADCVSEIKKAQSDAMQQASAKMEATLLRRIEQLNTEVKSLMQRHASEVKTLQEKHEQEMKSLRRRLDEVVRHQASADERVEKLGGKIQGMMDDIDRQAQAALQAELSMQSSQAASSGQVLSGDHFVPLSNTR